MVENELYDLINQNNNLRFVDVKQNAYFSLEEILLPVDKCIVANQALVFLYLNTEIQSLAIYLSFLNSKHCLLLLSDAIDFNLKEKLEKEYKPAVIYDVERVTITNYNTKLISTTSINVNIFFNEDYKTVVNQNIKILLSTSGTTGSPKLVKLSNTNLLQNALSISDYLPINSEDVTPINLALNYSYGLSVLHSNAINGGTIVCGLPDILSKEFWKYFQDFGFTSIAGVPFIYEMLYRIGFLKNEYPSLKYITQAGGNLSENIKVQFNDYCLQKNIKFFVMYGQTEATARISYVPPNRLKNKIKSIGIPIKNGNISIDKETEELLYSGPNVFGGYANEIEDLKSWENISELRSGDLAFKDEDGFFYIKGRLKRIVKIFGNRVNLDEIEEFIKSTLNISLLACLGIEDKFILIAHSNPNLDKAELKKKLFQIYKIQSAAIKFKFFEMLPKTKNEKINYKKITSIFLEDEVN